MSWKPEKATQAKMSIPVDWKPERAVQVKIRDTKINVLPVDRKPEKAIQEKVRDFKRQRTVSKESHIAESRIKTGLVQLHSTEAEVLKDS